MSENTVDASWTAGHGWLADGWQANLAFGVDARGHISESMASPAAQNMGDWVMPGMPNLHSHAFQRAMAGLAERRGRPDDSFWSWRETMYGFAATIEPDDLQAIAAQVYVEMLKAGYTQVSEFQYLHHQPDGTPYPQAEAMSWL